MKNNTRHPELDNHRHPELDSGSNIPKLRFPEFLDDGEWEEKTLSQLLTIGNGKDYKHLSNGEIPVYGTGGYMLSVDDYLYDGESVCIGRKGTIDKPMLLTGKFWTVDTLFYTHSFKNCIPKYIYYNFGTINWYNYNEAGGVPSLSKATINKINIPVPPKDGIQEQQKIADCLSSVDNLITAQSKKVQTLKEHKKALMQQLFPQDGEEVPKLRFPEFKNAPKWEEKILKELAENLDNKRVPITSNVRSRGNIPYYGASGIVDFVNDYIFDEELLCISEDGANLVARTYPIAFSISGKTWVNNHAHVLKFQNKYTQIIVENYLNSIKLDDFLTGMAQPKLNKAMLDIIPIPISSEPKEQQKIANFLSSIDELITSSTKKVETLKEHKKALMQQLFPLKEVQQ
jgi:type I restriction enzyme, S subunit